MLFDPSSDDIGISLLKKNWLVVTGTMEFYDFPFSWEWKNNPNCRTHIFQRGWYTTNQMLIWTWLVDVSGCLLYFTVLHFRDQHNEW